MLRSAAVGLTLLSQNLGPVQESCAAWLAYGVGDLELSLRVAGGFAVSHDQFAPGALANVPHLSAYPSA
jgi:hypothetical protein